MTVATTAVDQLTSVSGVPTSYLSQKFHKVENCIEEEMQHRKMLEMEMQKLKNEMN